MSEQSSGEESHSPTFLAGQCDCGHVTYPPHPICPACGGDQQGRVDLTDHVGEVLTWTEATTTPPGVREPNILAIAAFEIDGETVRALAGTTDSVSIGERVRPVPVDELRDPSQALRETDSQRWDGVRFEPLEG